MYIGLPGRISKDAAATFLMGATFVEELRKHFAKLSFLGITDGLVLRLDCFPPEGPLSGEIKPVRKLRNTTIRNDEGSLVRLPTLHSAGIALDHAGLLRCKTQRGLANFLAAEIRRQAQLVFARLPEFDREAFCEHIERVASQMPNDASSPSAWAATQTQ